MSTKRTPSVWLKPGLHRDPEHRRAMCMTTKLAVYMEVLYRADKKTGRCTIDVRSLAKALGVENHQQVSRAITELLGGKSRKQSGEACPPYLALADSDQSRRGGRYDVNVLQYPEWSGATPTPKVETDGVTKSSNHCDTKVETLGVSTVETPRVTTPPLRVSTISSHNARARTREPAAAAAAAEKPIHQHPSTPRDDVAEWLKSQGSWVPVEAWECIEDQAGLTLDAFKRKQLVAWINEHECVDCLSDTLREVAPENQPSPIRNWFAFFQRVWGSKATHCRSKAKRRRQPHDDIPRRTLEA